MDRASPQDSRGPSYPILFASLAASLLSAFLAMLGKQWLNRYQSTDMRGTAIERSQNRQRNLDGVVAWYFDYVLESLPLMLQVALLLLGCALSRYLCVDSGPNQVRSPVARKPVSTHELFYPEIKFLYLLSFHLQIV
jgi:hypothetical protein